MKTTILCFSIAATILFASLNISLAFASSNAANTKQFIYVLKLVERLHDDKAWTEEDKQAIGQHFQHLKKAAAEGKVILAGRTQESGDKTFGIVIFSATNPTAAKAFMQADPAVAKNLMTATLHPFAVAIQGEQ
jgi:uncharacterized protein YciI